MAYYQLKKTQKISASIEKVWDFISSPKNLKKITPSPMGFNIRENIWEGQIIHILFNFYYG